MRHWVIVIALLPVLAGTPGCHGAVSSSVRTQFQRAQEAFDKARTQDDFLRVAAMYEQIIESGVQSGAVFYNQGNAFARAGQRGRAIACYRQAQRYRPRDPQLDANLRFALGTDTTRPARSPIDAVLFWQDWLSYPEKFQLALGCAAVTLGLAVSAVCLRRPRWRRSAQAGLVITLAVCLSAGYDWYRFENSQHGVVTRGNTVARKGDAESYEAAFTTPLAEGTELTVMEQRRHWLRVRLAGGQEGWVPAASVVTY
jgi:hypothetical protein